MQPDDRVAECLGKDQRTPNRKKAGVRKRRAEPRRVSRVREPKRWVRSCQGAGRGRARGTNEKQAAAP